MNTKSHSTLAGAGVLAAIASSLCCVVPVVAALAGISGVASALSWIEPARPYLISFTVLTLGAAWYLKIRPRKTTADDCACEVNPGRQFFQSTKFLAFITVFAAIMTAFPLYAHIFYPESGQQAVMVQQDDIVKGKLTIEGMTCTGCEHHIITTLEKQKGVLEALASFTDGTATVKFDKNKNTIKQLAMAVEREAGYKVKSYKLLTGD